MRKRILANGFLSMLSAELEMITQAGISWSDGVLMLLDDREDKDGKAVLQSLFDGLERGLPLSAALRESGYFPAYMTGMAEAGERTGRLTETLTAMSAYYDRLERVEAALKKTVFYPAVLLVMMVAVTLLLLVRVLPVFGDVFARLGTRMPPFALKLTEIGGWLGDAAVLIAAIAGVLIAVAATVWLVPGLRRGAAGTLKREFGGRGVFGEAASRDFASAMALALASGLDAGDAVEMAGRISGGTREMDRRIARCGELLRGGSPLHAAMSGAGLLTKRETSMLALGAKSGASDAAMADIARRKERDVQDHIDRLIGRAEPTLVIAASALMGGVLLSVMLPLMGVMTTLGR